MTRPGVTCLLPYSTERCFSTLNLFYLRNKKIEYKKKKKAQKNPLNYKHQYLLFPLQLWWHSPALSGHGGTLWYMFWMVKCTLEVCVLLTVVSVCVWVWGREGGREGGVITQPAIGDEAAGDALSSCFISLWYLTFLTTDSNWPHSLTEVWHFSGGL